MSAYFRSLPAQVDLPALEHEVLDRWRDGKVFERSVEQNTDGPNWVFYEGPPTANGMPGVHHVEARVFKDVFPRYKSMQGYNVPRKAGWDCHGLPVEVAVEKELGLSGKKDIEEYGVAEFNARCRESVLRHVDAFEEMTERMGYWIDLSQAYRTMDPSYVESVWWSLKVVFDKDLLFRDFRITPYCPRCGTGLSDHELGQPGGYETVSSPSVYVRMPATSGPLADLGASLLIWTTTPWTLVSNTAVAVHPDVTYVAARPAGSDEVLVVAEPLLVSALGEGAEVLASFQGADLEHTTYSRPFELVDIPGAHYVVLGYYVTTEDGTGLVHQAPAFGADDLTTCKRYGLPVVNPIGPDGRFLDSVPQVGGQFFKDADEDLTEDLRARGLLYRGGHFEHSYPHCWRCHTALLYYALPAWYIRTTAIKEQLLAENEQTNWYPETIKWGRFGEWLRNNVDWSLSRSRYWGTPLPLWVCSADESHITCVGSLEELSRLSGQDVSALDPHRPYVDDITLPCPTCGAEARRVPDVIDAWYDSGSMPFAQWGAPYQNADMLEKAYPAQFICEATDQTRGWFYSLMAVGTLVFGRSSYENVLCLGLILAEDGRKMSKHLGNVLQPIPLMDQHGADALRWYMACAGSPWAARRVGHGALEEIVRKVLLTYWNTASFFTLYANAESWSPSRLSEAPPHAERPLIDRWVLAELHRTVAEVTASMDEFDTARVGRRLAEFLDDLSNWYVRRSRRRFWSGDASAFATLYECLETVTRLMSPVVPFITDYVWDVLRATEAPSSVHLAAWPSVTEELLDPALSEQMALVRRLVELGRSARASSGVKTRQPLGRALVGARGWAALSPELRDLIADELNVQGLEDLSGIEADLVSFTVKPNFRALGKRFGSQTKLVAAAVAAADAGELARALRSGSAVAVDAGELGTVELSGEEVIVTEQPKSGWAVETGAVDTGTGETVALDLTITDELRRSGLVRDVIRLLQDARKSTGLSISDRIDVWWSTTDADLAEALRTQGGTVAGEVLAVSLSEGSGGDLPAHHDADLDLTFQLRRTV
ncbi:isoleucine--tRNA ligase [Streptosporangium roseum]|uniref:Isoleucine--tRNA ligase n=1 Tax=Streptosporangium roseum (strain ATCC 12428 / DSM 43021 / JCM 3005 / KCTC 9067 / NCIMB 10171 / NRRL 2505 / NI 9100) TaxID=479432 RepID=D2B847_STRRD|nr:isoleucine--tRNA ligase [Streptosporangium roseum]ACZ85837.1 isoleucyl-tRNA synthetase [Streptosporangium roseum DSM 43021]